jgi:diphosphomevalonate decarboxylase
MSKKYSARAHPNIAFIKYWGNIDPVLRVPANGSISMTLGNLETHTTVEFDRKLSDDQVIINNEKSTGEAFSRAQSLLDIIRSQANLDSRATVNSKANFPIGTGLASSASGFAALTLAASKAAGLNPSQKELSMLARQASGSACRSIFGGFVEWLPGDNHSNSYALQIAEKDHWELIDVIAIVQEDEKEIGSTSGHALADSSPLQAARVLDASRRLDICRRAILDRDFSTLSQVVEEDSNMMHSVMITSKPPLLYWEPATISIMQNVVLWRDEGLEVCYTIDAGPNVHCICTSDSALEIQTRLGKLSGVNRILTSKPGGPAKLI